MINRSTSSQSSFLPLFMDFLFYSGVRKNSLLLKQRQQVPARTNFTPHLWGDPDPACGGVQAPYRRGIFKMEAVFFGLITWFQDCINSWKCVYFEIFRWSLSLALSGAGCRYAGAIQGVSDVLKAGIFGAHAQPGQLRKSRLVWANTIVFRKSYRKRLNAINSPSNAAICPQSVVPSCHVK